jgi:membrane protein YdbS with pleckstrin-like domain
MAERWRAWLLHVLRVPAEPAPPPGDPAVVRTFRASPNYFRYTVAVWVLKQASAAVGLLTSYLFFRNFVFFRGAGYGWIGIIEAVALTTFLIQLPFSYALLRLHFEMRWYILSDRSLRIREGILSVHEQTMAFANIQNISIRQNPLQRLFGIATVVVRAAGGGSSTTQKGPHGAGGSNSHEATFEGVDNAEQIRAAIRDRTRLRRDAGLGDPDDALVAIPRGQTGHAAVAAAERVSGSVSDNSLRPAIAAAQRVVREAAALRGALS